MQQRERPYTGPANAQQRLPQLSALDPVPDVRSHTTHTATSWGAASPSVAAYDGNRALAPRIAPGFVRANDGAVALLEQPR